MGMHTWGHVPIETRYVGALELELQEVMSHPV